MKSQEESESALSATGIPSKNAIVSFIDNTENH